MADLIKVEKDYEIAVETALGGNIQNIVTSDEETAKRMIRFLKQNRFGRATFLPLTSMKARGGIQRLEALKKRAVIGVADTLVKSDPAYRELVGYLLGRTLVVDNIDTGTAIARKYQQSLRIRNPGGRVDQSGGIHDRGAFKNSSNLLSRRREIEEFEKTVRQLKKRWMNSRQSQTGSGR